MRQRRKRVWVPCVHGSCALQRQWHPGHHFRPGGKVITSGPGANNLIQESDGRLVAPASTSTGGAVLRYNANGTLDTTFGSGGIVINAAFDVSAAAVYPTAGTANDGKIVVVGPGTTSGWWEAARYNPNGTLDSTFGSGGLVNTQTGTYAPRSVALQADGKVVAAGDGSILVRYNLDGSVDATFGTGDIDTTNVPGMRSVALQSNGDIVTGGSVHTSGSIELVAARFLPSEPEIGSFTANPSPVTSGSTVALAASNMTDADPGCTISQVAFYYYDSTGTKQVLAYGTQTSPGVWTLKYTVNLVSGSYTIYAQAEDSYGVFGDPIATTLQVL